MQLSELRGKLSRAPGILFNQAIKRSFPFWQALGLHVIPNHFYEPVPDTRRLKPELWDPMRETPGIDWRAEDQIRLLEEFASKYKSEYDAFPRTRTAVPHQFHLSNPSFTGVDGEILYCMIRHFRPRRIYEIGSGNSTYLAAQAVLKNQEECGQACELVAHEPYPTDVLRAGFPGLTRLEARPIQELPLEHFQALEPNDILFIDSSHVLKIGSDVQYEFLEIVPRLKPGVIVHFHDIFLPAEYPREWVLKHKIFWNEQYLLQAFMAFNDAFEILWGGSFMHLRHPEVLERHIGSYVGRRFWPGSFWVRKVR